MNRFKQTGDLWDQVKNTLKFLAMSTGFFAGYSIYVGNPKFYHKVLMPISKIIPPETSHVLAVQMAKYGFFPKYSNEKYSDLKVKLFGLEFNNPIGMAAGFDKHGEAVNGILDAGFSHVEVGSVTPLPQEGNPKPRVFRLSKDESVINRYGFNSDGHDVVYERLVNTDWKGKGIVGVNLGCNKTSTDKTKDYIKGINKFNNIADYIVINISSPNTPGLRSFQKKENLSKMLTEIANERKKLGKKTPLLIKISPDESDEDLNSICQIITQKDLCIDGVIVSNTTVSRPPELQSSKNLVEVTGGLSGAPLRAKSTAAIQKVHQLTQGRIPIIGVGGVSMGADAWEKMCAGASLVQLYTSLVYRGPTVAKSIIEDLHEIKTKEQILNKEHSST